MPERRGRARRPARREKAPSPLLAVDIGNSETVVGRFLGAELDGFWRLTSGRSTADELRIVLELLVRRSASGWGSILCSVVPSLTRSWSEALRQVTGRAPVELDASNAGLPIQVTEPMSVGPDRIANAFAASRLGGRPRVIATGGLAPILAPECETVDLVDEGLTLKGLRLQWEAMA